MGLLNAYVNVYLLLYCMGMPIITLIYADLLIILGLYGYFGTGTTSITALIPAFFGIALNIAGAISFKPNLRAVGMHAAVVLAFLGFAGSVPGLLKFPQLLSGGEVTRPFAVLSQSIMAIASAIFILLSVRSFIDARKARNNKE
jgi:hypothetical protein